jgi:hypothetical protein
MPKKRKTKKDKILLDHKKQVVHKDVNIVISSPVKETRQKQESSSSLTFSLPTDQHKPSEKLVINKPSSQTITVAQSEYTYLSNDLMRTALLTCAIFFTELFIKLFIVH